MRWSNHFLDSLSPADINLLRRELAPVELHRDEVLAMAGKPVRAAVFPVDAVVSVITVMRDGRSVESRTIGRESGFGLLHALGSRYASERVQVQVGGAGYEISVPALAACAVRSSSLTESIIRHAQVTLVQAAQATACNTLHSVEHRLCRWLLMTQDRLGSDVVPLTQEHLAMMLGVQRTTVTAIASRLQSRGVVSYSRGKIRILDRQSMRACACECYEAIEESVGQILGERLLAG